MKMSVFPIFEFTYSAENESYSKRAEGSFMNQKWIDIPVRVLIEI